MSHDYYGGRFNRENIPANLFRYAVRKHLCLINRPFEKTDIRDAIYFNEKDYAIVLSVSGGNKNVTNYSFRKNKEKSTECRILELADLVIKDFKPKYLEEINKFKLRVFLPTSKDNQTALGIRTNNLEKILVTDVCDIQGKENNITSLYFLDFYGKYI